MKENDKAKEVWWDDDLESYVRTCTRCKGCGSEPRIDDLEEDECCDLCDGFGVVKTELR